MEQAPQYSVTVEKTSDGYLVHTVENGRVTNRRLFSNGEKAEEYMNDERRRLGLGW